MKSSSLELGCPSASQDRRTLLFTRSFPSQRPVGLPRLREGPPSGFGYPLDELSVLRSLEAFSSSLRSWALAPQSFAPLGRSNRSFRISPSALVRSFQNLSALKRGLQRLDPFQKAVLLIAPPRIRSGRRLLLSRAFGSLRLSLQIEPLKCLFPT
jgi:hypothetical protein